MNAGIQVRRVYIQILGTMYEKNVNNFIQDINDLTDLGLEFENLSRTVHNELSFVTTDIANTIYDTLKYSLDELGLDFCIVSSELDLSETEVYLSQDYDINSKTVDNFRDLINGDEYVESNEVGMERIVKLVAENNLIDIESLYDELSEQSESIEEFNELLKIASENGMPSMKKYIDQKVFSIF